MLFRSKKADREATTNIELRSRASSLLETSTASRLVQSPFFLRAAAEMSESSFLSANCEASPIPTELSAATCPLLGDVNCCSGVVYACCWYAAGTDGGYGREFGAAYSPRHPPASCPCPYPCPASFFFGAGARFFERKLYSLSANQRTGSRTGT